MTDDCHEEEEDAEADGVCDGGVWGLQVQPQHFTVLIFSACSICSCCVITGVHIYPFPPMGCLGSLKHVQLELVESINNRTSKHCPSNYGSHSISKRIVHSCCQFLTTELLNRKHY